MITLSAGELDKRIRIERPVADPEAESDAVTWQLFAEVWASVRDMLPSRSERSRDGLTATSQAARVRLRWLPGITAEMRIVAGTRTYQIVGGPAELGRRVGIELMVEEYRPAGGR